MKKMLRTVAALTLGGCLMAGNVMAATTTFSDAPSSYWGYTYITKAAQDGLVSGIGNGKFGVEDKLSNAQFTTMICNLFYKDEVMNYQNTYKPSEWWQSYMAVAYTKGLLTNTTVGESRQSTQKWSAQVVNASISRYDMAQIMVNVASQQGWQNATTLEILSAKMKIKDWDKIPDKYQNAVASAYAKGFLSGMETGNFEGSSAMTRTHGAVVVCKLADAKKTGAAPVYTNTTKLVNGSTATQANVKSALTMLKIEYPNNGSWDTTKTYTSTVLGSAYGCDAFAYILSDRVFGNMAASKSKAEDLKPGDVVYLSSKRIYVIVVDVDADDEEFTYAYCNTNGKITWNNTEEIDELGSKDTIYTRYSDTSSSSSTSGTLSNDKSATESNVKALIKTFKKDEYRDGDKWDMKDEYKSSQFSKSYVEGDQAFAYYLSDYIFGKNAQVKDVSDADDIRAGDVIYWNDEDMYIVVTDHDDDDIYYVRVSSTGRVYWDNDAIKEKDLGSKDYIYTRYPSKSSSSSSSSSKTGTLSDGSKATESNVESLLSKFKKKYGEGDDWTKSSYSSKVLSDGGKVYDSEAFAYYLSDDIFGDLKATETTFAKARVGDVIRIYNKSSDDDFGVVVSATSSKITYVSIDSDGEVSWKYTVYKEDWTTKDTIYTRYPSSSSSSSSSSSKKYLSNGDRATSDNVYALLQELQEKKSYKDGKYWDTDEEYDTEVFGSCTGSEAFAWVLSDAVFDDLDYTKHYDADKLQIGDIVYLKSDKEYIVVTDIGSKSFNYVTLDRDDEIDWNNSMKINDLSSKDAIYTRY